MSWRAGDDGSLVLNGRLPAEDGERMLAALDAADAAHEAEQPAVAKRERADPGYPPDVPRETPWGADC